MTRERAFDIITAVVAACAVVVTGLTVKRHFFELPQASAAQPTGKVKDWRAYASGRNLIGSKNAPVTIITFSDFQCPFCKRLAKSLRDVQPKFGTDLAVVFRHLPLAIHEAAMDAAIAAECAQNAGKFEPYHNLLFEKQDSLGKLSWTELATRVGIRDTARFVSCLSSVDSQTSIKADVAAARRLKIFVTPSLLINGVRWSGAPSSEELDSLITLQLNKRSQR